MTMRPQPKVGEIGEIRFTVEETHAIDFADDQMPAILSTPWLIWFLEHSARNAVLPYLQEGESTVGTHVDVQHLAATPLGQSVVCQARVIHCDWPVISFQLEAKDEHELISRGLHKLRVIRCERLARRVNAKASS